MKEYGFHVSIITAWYVAEFSGEASYLRYSSVVIFNYSHSTKQLET